MSALAGKRALVTGASRGIGAAIAVAFARAGATVAVHYRSGATEAEAVRTQLAQLHPAWHTLVCADLSAEQGAKEMVDAAHAALGGLDVLVNNAGVYEEVGVDADWERWQQAWSRSLSLNLLGPAHASYWAARVMSPGARIINIGSRGAYRGEPSAPAYGAAKAGLHQLTQSLAIALAPRGISVLGVAPGFVETEMARAILESERGDAIRAQSPFGRVARADEVAYWVTCAAADEAAFASGAILDVNGASYLR